MNQKLLGLVCLTILQSGPVLADSIVINEIMYHPAPAVPEDPGQEWIELYNKGTNAVNLNDWRLTRSISYTFTNRSIPAGAYLVVAANTNTFASRYPAVGNVVGNWAGALANNGSTIELEDATGHQVDKVSYASQGDWAVRVRGPNDLGHYGWTWFTEADGLNKSIELVNPGMPNKYGQNWGSSVPTYGTPGAQNSVLRLNTAPLIVDVAHFPIVPQSSNSVTITATVLDEQTNGITVQLFSRNASATSPPPFSSTPMFDDGAHGDGLAGDGVYGATLPANPNGTVIEYYVQASDSSSNTRTWPAPARQLDGITFAQTANALFQVDDSVYSGNQPFYRVIMTETERQELDTIGRNAANSDAEMNGTFISREGTGTELRYLMGFRNRGHGSRTAQPNNIRINFPNDHTWHGVRAINLNTRYTHAQVFGSAIFQKAGLPMANSRPVQVRVNGANLAQSGSPMFGSYAHNEELSSEFAANHFPTDSEGNCYRGIRIDPNLAYANLNYYGPNITNCATPPACYLNLYVKQNNQSENNFSDILELTRVLATSPDDEYTTEVRRVMDVEDAMLYFAVNTLADNRETSLSNGEGDDYAMYRGAIDTRMKLFPYDVDTIFGEGDSPGSVTAGLFRMTNTPFSGVDRTNTAIIRFITWPEFTPIYYAVLKKQAETTMSAAQFNPLVDRVLGDWVQPSTLDSMKGWMAARAAFVLSQIPLNLAVLTAPPFVNGYPQTTVPSATLSGRANAIDTRTVKVNGALAAWNHLAATWNTTVTGLKPGINRILIQAFGIGGLEVARTNIDIWYDRGTVVNVSGAITSNTTWTAAAGPYNVTGSLTIGNGVALTIQAGTTVYFAPGTTLTVSGSGQLLAQGTEAAHIRFTRTPGGGNWGSVDFIGATNESRLAYVDFEFCGGTTISSHNAQVHVNNSVVFIDHCTWPSTPVIEFISFDNSSFIVQNCFFPSYPPPTGPESLHGVNGIPINGYGIFRDNYFGRTWGFNDTIDFTGGQRPGAILQIINNVFDGAGDDNLDLDSTDAWIEGNIFMHVHRDANRSDDARDTSSAISGGVDFANQFSEWTVINNLFYDVDHAILNKGSGSLAGAGRFIFVNNTVVHVNKENGAGLTNDIAAFDFTDDGVPLPGPSYGAGAYVAGNIIWDCPALVANYSSNNHTVIFENNILPVSWNGPGSNNVVIDPHLNLAQITNVATADWKTVKAALTPIPGSPALGTGVGGFDRGGLNPKGLLVYGEPVGTTASTSATLTVAPGGTFNWGANPPVPPYQWGYTSYKWKLDNGPWSAETSITTSPTISLTGLANGPHTVYVIGKNDAPPGYYQNDVFVYPSTAGIPAHTNSTRTWIVNSAYSHLRLNEVLAKNETAVVYNDGYPDLIELYNDGGTTITLAGMGITDDPANKFKFIFPVGTSIAPGGYLVLFADNPDGSPGLHLGFALNANGDGVFLYDSSSNLLDSVVFGLQLADLSIGRMPDGSWTLTRPTFGGANTRQGLGDPRLLKINEWLTSSQNNSVPDFIELFNADALAVDLGSLYLSDAPQGSPKRHRIPALSFIAGGGYTILLADGQPDSGADHLSFSLSSLQGQIGLFAQDGSLIDCILYRAQTANVSEGRTPSGANQFGYFTNPTPGSANPAPSGSCTVTTVALNLLPMITTWTYNRDGFDLGTDWRAPGYDDSGWSTGLALLGVEDCGCLPFGPFPNTIFPNYVNTQIPYYFRTTFVVESNLSGLNLAFSYVLDDGAVIYLDGAELTRIRMPGGTIFANTLPTVTVNNATLETLTLPNINLAAGLHYLAVEVHNNVNPNSTDLVWGLELDATTSITNCTQFNVVLNEVMAHPVTIPGPGGAVTDWVELYNPSAATIDLSDMSMSDNTANPRRWVFPSGVTLPSGSYLVVRFDPAAPPSTNNGGILNAGFGLDADSDQVLLYDAMARGGALLDAVAFGSQAADFSIGHVPNSSGPWTLNLPTPGGQNIGASLGSINQLKINEWMADPNNGPDWFEIYNPSPQPINVGGLFLTDDLNSRAQYRIPALSFIGTGEDGFAEFFADGTPNLGAKHTNFKLSAGGEAIGLFAENGAPIDTIIFGAQQRGVSEGRYPDGSTNIARFPNTETPAASNLLPLSDVVVSEVLTHTDAPLEDAIELQNTTIGSVDISGWYLSNKRTDPKRFRIPKGTVIPADGLIVFYEYQFNPFPGVLPSFALDSAHGDQVYLFSTDTDGNLLARTGENFGAVENGVSFGRYSTSVAADFTALSQRTFGADSPASLAQFRTGTGLSNAYPKIGPVVINEIMYQPPPIGTNDDVIDEFIELRNISAEAVSLFDINFPTNTWRLRDGVDFQFPTNNSIPAGGYLLVVSFDPVADTTTLTAFRGRYGLAPSVPIFGPYAGKLDNGGEKIELVRPDAPQPLGQADAGFVPYIVVDHVKYSDSSPWPSAADGNTNGVGLSLQRKNPSEYGNDPVNWIAGAPTPGSPTGPAVITPPAITSLTPPQLLAQGASATLTVNASGAAPLSYQWRLNGVVIVGATNATLPLGNMQASQVGNYSVLVSNPAGAASATTRIDVMLPPAITREPQSIGITAGGTAVFTVSARGSAPLAYQWQKNGTNLPGAGNVVLTINDVQSSDVGSYRTVITNLYGSVTSAPASLSLSVAPLIVSQPRSTNVFVGASATFTVSAVGDAPLRYQWFLNNGLIPNATNSTITLSNLQTSDSGNFTVRVTNNFGSVLSSIAALSVAVPPAVTVVASDASAAETGPDPGQFTITRTGSTTVPLTVFFTMGGSATPGGDYTALVNSVTIQPGAASTNLAVIPVDDSVREAVETVMMTLSTNEAYVVGFPGSAIVSILDNDNLPPAITLANPPGGSSFAGPVNIVLGASASDSDGSVTRVDFYADATTKLGTATTVPYVITWTNASGGNHVLTAVATDNLGATNTSTPVSIYVNTPPSVSIISPANGAGFSTPADITITANAADNGSVALVEFFAGTNLLGSRVASPYTITWTNVPVGSYSLTARATDNQGTTNTSAPVNINVHVPSRNFTDNFAERGQLFGKTNFVIGTNVDYTHEPDEPKHWQFASGTNSAWISWTAPESGSCTMSTVTNGLSGVSNVFDTVMAVYTGTTLSNLTLVASNDDFDFNFSWFLSQVTFNAVAGTTYHVAVDSYGTSTGESGNFYFRQIMQEVVPVITAQPQSTNVNQGGTASFTVGVAGPIQFSYQWFFRGTNLPNASNPSLVLTGVTTNNTGPYFVVVSSGSHSVTSSVATLTVLAPPVITQQPQGQVVNPGTNVVFSVSVVGAPPIRYQWRYNGLVISGASSNTYTIPNAQYTNAGIYTVFIANTLGSVTTQPAELIVRPKIAQGLFTNGAFRLTLNGTPGKQYAIERATNMPSWSVLSNVTHSAVELQFFDSTASTLSNRVYRLRFVQ